MSVVTFPTKNLKSPFASMQGNHVAVRVPDFEIAVKWYIEKLDFRMVHEWPFADMQLCYMAPANDDNFTVEIMGGGDPKPVPKPVYEDVMDSLRPVGFHHFCLTVENMEQAIEELRRRDVAIVMEPFYLEAINRKLAFISDPFGNLIELAESVS